MVDALDYDFQFDVARCRSLRVLQEAAAAAAAAADTSAAAAADFR